MKKLTLILVSLLWSILAICQIDTVVVMDKVEVVSIPIRNNEVGHDVKSWSTDSLSMGSSLSLSGHLQQTANVYIKNYGTGSLSTPSIRGGSAAHTLVLWNDLPVHSPMLGLLDFSLLPMLAFSRVSLVKGGSTSTWGSGAVSSTIHLQGGHEMDHPTLELGLTYGSWRRKNFDITAKVGKDRLHGRTYIQYGEAKNNFEYSVSQNLPTRIQENADFSTLHILQDIHWNVNVHHHLSLHTWYQKGDRGIPPLTTQTRSIARQEDIAKRLSLGWKYIGANRVIRSKLGYFDEDNNYHDSLTLIDAKNHFERVMYDVDIEQILSDRIRVSAGYAHVSTTATSGGYSDEEQEHRHAIHLSIQMGEPMWSLQMGIRQEWIDALVVPLMPYLSGSWKIGNILHVKGNMSKVYRAPTLNDKYWSPGGNQNLRPEQGWSYELGATLDKEIGPISWKYNATGFTRKIQDWILWVPREGEPFYSANNIAEVWSRGLEQRLELAHTTKQRVIKLSTAYDYILSTNEIEITQPTISKGQQLLYTPKHSAQMIAAIHQSNQYIRYTHQLTGSTLGVNEDIPEFAVGSLAVGCIVNNRSGQLNLSLEVNNIWGIKYQIVERRPMPGREWTLNFKYKIKQ